MTVTYEFAMDFNKPEVNHNVMQLDLSIGKGHFVLIHLYEHTVTHTYKHSVNRSCYSDH